jgi:hypothetical protein
VTRAGKLKRSPCCCCPIGARNVGEPDAGSNATNVVPGSMPAP